VINFQARRRAPGTPRPPVPPAAKPNERRLGVAPGGGYFGLKGIYVLTADGMLHEQVITTGADFAPPVKFLPAAGGDPSGLNFAGSTIFTTTDHGCGSVADGLWSVELASGEYRVRSYQTEGVHPLSLTGPVMGADGTSFLVTSKGTAAGDAHAGSVIAVSREMKATDWYEPAGGMASYEHVSPIAFEYKGKKVVAGPGRDGGIALLDASSLGGTDHHTALAESAPVARPGAKHGWDGFAEWQDQSGATWIFASISAPVTEFHGSVTLNGPVSHGAIAAFRVDESNGQPSLAPVWVSQDMVNPAPPRIANGVVVALAGGNATTHATLYLLNAATGAELYSSKNEVPTYTGLSGVSVGDGHVFFTDHNDELYSFGIALEH